MKLLPLVVVIIGLASCTQVKQVDGNSRAEVLAEDKISFVNFYADWCRYGVKGQVVSSEKMET